MKTDTGLSPLGLSDAFLRHEQLIACCWSWPELLFALSSTISSESILGIPPIYPSPRVLSLLHGGFNRMGAEISPMWNGDGDYYTTLTHSQGLLLGDHMRRPRATPTGLRV